MDELQEKLVAKDAAFNLVVHASCATLGPSRRCLVENFCLGFDKSVGDAFHLGSLQTKIHADTAIDSMTLHFSEDAASEEVEAGT